MIVRPDFSRHASRISVAVTAALVLTACGEGDPKPGPEVAGGNAGVDERVTTDVKVLDVELAYPLDHVYEQGEDASLYLAISNTGEIGRSLVSVSGPDFSDARVGGTAAAFPIQVDPNDTLYIGAEDEPSITLVNLGRTLRSSESIPVTFRFDDGEVTVEAVVAAEGQTPSRSNDFPDPDEDPSG